MVEIVERFGWTPWRRRLLDGLAESLDLLAEAGCRRVWLNGSFVTAQDEPGDFDAVWDPEHVDDDALDPIFGPLGLLDGRRLQKERFGGEWFGEHDRARQRCRVRQLLPTGPQLPSQRDRRP